MWATRPQSLPRKDNFDQSTPQRNRPEYLENPGFGKANTSDKSKGSRDKKKSKKRDRAASTDLEGGKRGSPISSLPSLEAESYLGGLASGTP